MAGDAEKAELIRELAAARERLTAASAALRDAGTAAGKKLDVPSRIAGNFERHRPAWLGGAAIFGLLLSKLPARKKTVVVERSTGEKLGSLGSAGKLGALWGAAKFLGGLARPFLGDLLAQRVGDLARRAGKKPPE